MSGEIRLTRGQIVYDSGSGSAWSVHVSAVALVGEFATGSEAPEQSHFIVLAFRDLSWYRVPVGAFGMPDFLDAVGEILGATLQPTIGDSEALESRVLWPPAMIGESLLMCREDSAGEPEDRGLFGVVPFDYCLTPQVLAFLGSGPVARGGIA